MHNVIISIATVFIFFTLNSGAFANGYLTLNVKSDGRDYRRNNSGCINCNGENESVIMITGPGYKQNNGERKETTLPYEGSVTLTDTCSGSWMHVTKCWWDVKVDHCSFQVTFEVETGFFGEQKIANCKSDFVGGKGKCHDSSNVSGKTCHINLIHFPQ